MDGAASAVDVVVIPRVAILPNNIVTTMLSNTKRRIIGLSPLIIEEPDRVPILKKTIDDQVTTPRAHHAQSVQRSRSEKTMASFPGRIIKAARLNQHLSQEALARGLCDRSTISRIERGAYDPPPDLWPHLAERLGLPQALTAIHPPPPEPADRPLTAGRQIRVAVATQQYDEARRTWLSNGEWISSPHGHSCQRNP